MSPLDAIQMKSRQKLADICNECFDPDYSSLADVSWYYSLDMDQVLPTATVTDPELAVQTWTQAQVILRDHERLIRQAFRMPLKARN